MTTDEIQQLVQRAMYEHQRHVVGVAEPDIDWLHAVVMRGTQLLHDPMPKHLRQWNPRVGSVVDFTVLAPMDPSRPIQIPNDRQFAHYHEPANSLTDRRARLRIVR